MAATTNYRDQVLEALPVISPMAMRLVGRLGYSGVNFAEVKDLIEKDTMLCSEVMRTVNSARYSRGNPRNRIESAVALLGSNRLRRLALGITVSNLFKRPNTSPRWSQLRFNLHSAAVAVMADLISGHVAVAGSEGAFIGGLFHDIGKFAIAVNLKLEYSMILDLWSSSGNGIAECEREVLGFDHAEISGLILARWELPSTLQRAVFYHHRPDAGSDEISLAHVLDLSNRFVHYLGMTTEPTSPDANQPCALELCGRELPEADLLESFAAEYEEFSSFFI